MPTAPHLAATAAPPAVVVNASGAQHSGDHRRSAQPPAVPFDLARYRGRKRVLVLFAPSAADSALAAEDAALRERAAGVADRDLVVVRVLEAGAGSADGQPLDAADAAALRRRLRAGAGRFTAVLVGKDGHVAMRSYAPVVAGALFPTIDAMPMRRAEVARRAGRAGP